MQVKFMITDNGPHPADKWAAITAEAICDLIEIDQNSQSPAAVAARKLKPRLQLDLADALEAHHIEIQTSERSEIKKHGCKRLGHSLDCTDSRDCAVDCVLDILDATPWGAHFRAEPALTIIKRIIGQHFATAMHIERSWHADRNPNDPAAKAFRARHPA